MGSCTPPPRESATWPLLPAARVKLIILFSQRGLASHYQILKCQERGEGGVVVVLGKSLAMRVATEKVCWNDVSVGRTFVLGRICVLATAS